MNIGGLLKTSLIDFPGTICAVVYTSGCNFRCPFCHNPDLVIPARYRTLISEDDFFSFLKKRQGQLEGITVTGGEPLMHADAPEFLRQIKSFGYKVKLDTNGSFPQMLKSVLEEGIVDYVAMDVKAPNGKYARLAGVAVDLAAIEESISLIKTLAPDYEFRTTVAKTLLSPEDIRDIIAMIAPAKRYVVQRFRCEDDIIDGSIAEQIFKDPEFVIFSNAVKSYVGSNAVHFR
jgi:pyruvate formate lyase activating enzyme